MRADAVFGPTSRASMTSAAPSSAASRLGAAAERVGEADALRLSRLSGRAVAAASTPPPAGRARRGAYLTVLVMPAARP